MSQHSCKIWGHIRLRVYKAGYVKKPGLHIESIWDTPDKARRISDSEIIRLRDWLSLYIAKNIHQIENPLATDIRLKARAIERAAYKLEGQS